MVYNYVGSYDYIILNGLILWYLLDGFESHPRHLKKKQMGELYMESFKNWSRITNILVFIAGFISYVGADGLKGVIPAEYQYLIPFIVMAAGYVLVQLSEDKRVEVAEHLVQIKNNETPLNPEYEIKWDEENGT